MGIMTIHMDIRKEIGREWRAYRGVEKEAEEIYGSDRDKLPGILRLPVSAAGRLCAEIDAVIMYLKQRIDVNSPETIAAQCETLNRGYKR